MTNKIILISGMILTVCLSGCKGEDNSSEKNHSDSAVVTTSVTNAEAATSSVITTTALAAEEMTVPQIAEVMKIPEGTVKSRQHTIVRNLKQKLKIYEIRR